MGCDIHLYVERRENGRWISADRWTNDREYSDIPDVDYDHRFYNSRNYDLFSILADVRNGYGFAGITTGVGFIPISKPKGLPEDVTGEVRAAAEEWGIDGHSHSWHTVQQLLDYDWTQTTMKLGVVDAIQYYDWTRYRRGEGEGPESYAGAVSGGGTKHVSEEEMERIVSVWREKLKGVYGEQYTSMMTDFTHTCSHIYTQVSWSSPYYKRVEGFLSQTMPRLWRLGKPEDVRIVFWFDN